MGRSASFLSHLKISFLGHFRLVNEEGSMGHNCDHIGIFLLLAHCDDNDESGTLDCGVTRRALGQGGWGSS